MPLRSAYKENSEIPMTASRAAISQRTPHEAPQIVWTPRAGSGPLTPSDGEMYYLPSPHSANETSSSIQDYNNDTVNCGIAQGTATAVGSERRTLSSIPASPSSSSAQESDQSGGAILEHAFQAERSPTGSTADSEAVVQTAYIQQGTLSRATTYGSSSSAPQTLRDKIELGRRFTRSSYQPAVQHAQSLSQVTRVSSGHLTQSQAGPDADKDAGQDEPSASRQRSLRVPIEEVGASEGEGRDRMGSLQTGEAWWNGSSVVTEATSESDERPRSVGSASSSLSSEHSELSFVHLPSRI